jgi:hypothetical protein
VRYDGVGLVVMSTRHSASGRTEPYMNRPETPPIKLVAAVERPLLKRLFGRCAHQFSWPHSGENGMDYQVCLRCGVAYEYDCANMRRTERVLTPEIRVE